MTVLRAALRVEVVLLSAGFTTLLAWKVARGVVQWARRPETRTAFRGGVTAALRLQMPAVGLLVALYYFTRLPGAAASGNLPPVPESVLAFLAASQLTFLGVVARSRLRRFGTLRNEGEK